MYGTAVNDTRPVLTRRERLQNLADENAKLRELALMMLLVCKSKGIVGGVFARPDGNRNLNERVDFESRARELGIEVPS